MGSKRHSCNCWYCVDGRGVRQELQHGGLDWDEDEDDLVPYRKSRRKGFGRKKTKPCSRSKTDEPCEFNETVFKGTRRNPRTNANEPRPVRVCGRCGRYDWSFYSWW